MHAHIRTHTTGGSPPTWKSTYTYIHTYTYTYTHTHDRWKSSDVERELYSKITKRVEQALLELYTYIHTHIHTYIHAHNRWKSSEVERELYSKITKRVEQALLDLEAGAQEDMANNPDPQVKYFCERSLQALAEVRPLRHEKVL